MPDGRGYMPPQQQPPSPYAPPAYPVGRPPTAPLQPPTPTPPPRPGVAEAKLRLPAGLIVLRVVAIILLVLTVFWHLYITNPDFDFTAGMQQLSLICVCSALGLGCVGIWLSNIRIASSDKVPTLNVIFIIVSIGCILAAIAVGSWGDTTFMDMSKLTEDKIFGILILAVFTLGYIELSHASIRFLNIAEFAHNQNLTDFSVNAVVGSYFIWFPILFFLIVIFSYGVLKLNQLLIWLVEGVSPQFAASLELNSIYGVAAAIALIFVPVGVILTIIFGRESYVRAYKRLTRAGPPPIPEEERGPERTAAGQIIVR